MKKKKLFLLCLINIALAGCSESTNTNSAPNSQVIEPATPEQPATPEPPAVPEQPIQDEPTPTTDVDTSLALPAMLTGVVYTDTETELFWERSTDSRIVSYRISRDGAVLAIRDSLSYYDNRVQPGTTYEYTVESRTNDKAYSNPVSIFLTTPEAAPTLNTANARTILNYAAAVTTGAIFQDVLSETNTIQGITHSPNAIEQGFIPVSTITNDEGQTFNSTYDCEFGGQYFVRRTSSSLPTSSITMRNCKSSVFGDDTIDGFMNSDAFLTKYAFNAGVGRTLSMLDFSITDANNNKTTFTGDYYAFGGDLSSWRFEEYAEYELAVKTAVPFEYFAPAFEGSTQLSVNLINRTRGLERSDESEIYRHTLEADFSVQSPATGNKRISVTTLTPFSADEDLGCFLTGQMQLTADDGSRILFDANTGTENEVSVTITADGITTTETWDWTSELAFMHITPYDIIDTAGFELNDLPVYPDCVENGTN